MFNPFRRPLLLLPLGVLFLPAGPLLAQGTALPAGPAAPGWTQSAEDPLPSERQEALEALNAALQDASLDFNAAHEQAVAAGVDEQTLFESRIVHELRGGDLDALIRLAPRFPPLRNQLEYGGDRLFVSPMDFEAFVEAIYARRAYLEGDVRAFGAYARNSYWKGPHWVQLLGVSALVQEERIKEESARLLADVRLSLDRPLPTAGEGAVTLAELLDGRKALLLDLWGSWCEPCIRNFPRLQARADEMKPHGVVVAALNVDEENQREHAERYRELHNMRLPWILDPLEDSLSLQLRIGTVPRVALIGPEGEILFTGLPNDPELLNLLEGFQGDGEMSDAPGATAE